MSKQHDGGPAFPVWELNGQGKPEMTGFGMTLRDFLAAKAMQSYLADGDASWDEKCRNHCAKLSYQLADAMLKARNT